MKKNNLSKHAGEPLVKLCYLTLLLLSGDTNIELNYHNIADRFFIDTKTARRIIALLENFVCEDINTHIALEGSSYDSIRRNPHSEIYTLPQLRLTQSEIQAFLSALISTGLENNNYILKKLEAVAPVDSDIDEILSQNYTADHTSHHAITPWMITICCLSHQRFTFDYRRKDGSLKTYIVDPLYPMYKEERWYLNAWDIEDNIQKYFLLSKMKKLAPADCSAEEHQYVKLNSFTFDGEETSVVRFENPTYFDIIGHAGFSDIKRDETSVEVSHTCSQPDWIAKQVAAGNGQIICENEIVNVGAKKFAQSLLEKARSI